MTQTKPKCCSAGTLDELTITKGHRSQLGSCCFCTSDHKIVHQLSGHHLQVRLCNKCLEKVKKHKPE